ncbi:MAG: CBS domain-containing protein [Chloroflexota bacterium]
MLVKDFMHTDVLQIKPYATLREAAEIMLANKVDALVIEDERGALQGVVGLRDLFTAPIPAHYGNPMFRHENENQLLEVWASVTVQNLMNDKALSVSEDTTLIRALELMVNTGKHPLPVLRDGRVVGIISRSDIARAVLAQSMPSP